MQQKGGAQPLPSSSTAQQQPNYNVSSSMGWRQSMGMQYPAWNGIRHDANVYIYPMYGQYGMQPGMIGTRYGMNQFQRPQ